MWGIEVMTMISDDIEKVGKALSYFAREHKKDSGKRGPAYHYIDRISNAISSELAIEALYDAIRALRSLKHQGENVYIPSQETIKRVVEEIRKDITTTKLIAIIALSYGIEEAKSGERSEERG